MIVKYKPTGQLGQIPDDKYDPNLFEPAQAPQMPQQHQEPIQSQAPMSTAPTDPEAQMRNNPPSEWTSGNKIVDTAVDWLPTIGATIGGVAGAELGPGALATAGAGGALGETAKQYIHGHMGQNATNESLNPKDIAIQGALGTAGEFGGQILGKVAGKVLGKAGSSLEKIGEDLGLRSIRPTASQLTNYSEKYGEDMATTLANNKILGQGVDGINAGIKPLQESFSKIVKESGIKVDPASLDKVFYEHIGKLLESPAAEDHALAEKLVNEYGNITSKLGEGPIDLSKLNSYRQIYDGKVKDWMSDPIMAGKNRLVGNILRNTIQQAADNAGATGVGGQSLKQMGMELSKLYHIQDIAERQANLGRGTLPAGLQALLEGNLGNAIGSASGVGGIPGAVIGMAAGKIINKPSTMALLSRMASKTGENISNASLPAVPNLLGQSIVQGGKNLISPQPTIPNNSDNSNYSNNSTQFLSPIAENEQNNSGQTTQNNTLDHGPSIPSTSSSLPMTPGEKPIALTGHTPEEHYAAYQQARAVGDNKAAAEIYREFQDETAYQKEQSTKSKPKALTAVQQQMIANVSSALRSLDTVDEQLGKTPNGDYTNTGIMMKAELPGVIGRVAGASTYNTARKEVMDVIARMRTGAVITPSEEALYLSKLPAVGDSTKDIKYKMGQMRQVFSDLKSRIENQSLPANPADIQFDQGLPANPSL